jgi:hypothetical protein
VKDVADDRFKGTGIDRAISDDDEVLDASSNGRCKDENRREADKDAIGAHQRRS